MHSEAIRRDRRGLQQVAHFLLPELRLEGGSVACGLVAGGYQQNTSVLHALDLAVQNPKLRGLRSSSAELIANSAA